MKTSYNCARYSLLIFLFSIKSYASVVIILLGPPGAGKNTLSSDLVTNHGFVHICPGNLFRKEVRENTAFGLKVKDIINAGDYLTEKVTFDYLKQYIQKNLVENKSIVIDGYPRSVEALQMLDKLLIQLNVKANTIILHLDIPRQLIYQRVLGRLVCNKCDVSYLSDTCNLNNGKCQNCGQNLEKHKHDTAGALSRRIAIYNSRISSVIEDPKLKKYKYVYLYAKDNNLKLNLPEYIHAANQYP